MVWSSFYDSVDLAASGTKYVLRENRRAAQPSNRFEYHDRFFPGFSHLEHINIPRGGRGLRISEHHYQTP